MIEAIQWDSTNWDLAVEGYRDAIEGEPLYPDADPSYTIGWCIFHGIQNPYQDVTERGMQ